MEVGCSIYDRSTTFRPNRWLGPPKYGYGKDGKPLLTKGRKLLLNDNNAGKYAQTFLE